MLFDLDQILDAAKPWDFTVQVGGVSYPTRRPNVGELAAIAAAGGDPARLFGVVAGLFAGDARPDVNAWSIEQVIAFVSGYTAYFVRANQSGKDPAAIVAAAGATVAEAMASGG